MNLSVHEKIADADALARSLIAVVTDLVHELHGPKASSLDVTLSSRLDRDLGIDSLGRTELILRIERAFRTRLPVNVMGEADTVGDLLTALQQAASARGTLETGFILPTEVRSYAAQVGPAAEARTLVEALQWHVARNPDRPHVTVLEDERAVIGTASYSELAKAAKAVAASLIEQDVLPGDRVALMLPTGMEFFEAFFGILYAGAVPVPIYPPMQLSQLEDYLRRQAKILCLSLIHI